MSSCRRTAHWIQLYLDGRLPPRVLGPLERHLAGCEACRADLRAFEIITASLDSDLDGQEAPDLAPAIMLRIAWLEESRASYQAQGSLLRWADALLAVLLASIFTAAFVLFDPGLREAFPLAFSHSFPSLVAILNTQGPGSIAWIVWGIWIGTGAALAIWLAGPDARSFWRESLTQHLPR